MLRRSRYLLAVLSVVVLVGFLLFALPRNRRPDRMVLGTGTPTQERGGTPGSLVQPTPEAPQSRAARHHNEIEQAAGSLNKPIRFWGKVVDQDNTPVPGVNISFKTRSAYVPMFAWLGSKESHGKISTSEDGSFYIDGGKGDMLGLYEFSKPGYRLAEGASSGFAYAGSPKIHHPNAEQPVLYIMYQDMGVEPLYHYDDRFDLLADGTPITINLVTGQVDSAGQLRISLWRNPKNINLGKQFQWSTKIEVVGGGLQKASEKGAYIAPTEGYKSVVEYAYQPKMGNWDSTWDGGIRQMLYFRTADEKYGRMVIHFHVDLDPPPIFLFVESWLNPSGRRFLQYDSTKRISIP